jgi:NAD(P)-dependent dehydrogenase (short-subunit alcohol dehydrogenase family)
MHRIDWMRLNMSDVSVVSDLVTENLDLIVFNQNSRGISVNYFDDHTVDLPFWNQKLFADCQFGYYILKKLQPRTHKNTKVVWITSGLAHYMEPRWCEFAGYGMSKNAALYVMKGFSMQKSHDGIFFAVDPDPLLSDAYEKDAATLGKLIVNAPAYFNGNIVNKEGKLWMWGQSWGHPNNP